MEIIQKLGVHHRLILRIIRKHFLFSSEKQQTASPNRIDINDYVRAMTVGKVEIQEINNLSYESEYISKVKYFGFSILLSKLANLDSHALLNFLREYGHSGEIYEYLKAHYPSGIDYLQSKEMLNVVKMETSHRTFDEIRTLHGLGYKGETFSNVDIWHQRFLVKDNSLLEFDSTGAHYLAFVAGHWQHLSPGKLASDFAFLEKPEKKLPDIDEAIFLSGRADENWYHLLLDTLPRYLLMKDLPKNISVLIRDDLPATTFEFLAKIIDRPILKLTPKSIVRVRQLHFVAARSSVFDSEDHTSDRRVYFSPMTTVEMANWIREKLEIDHTETCSSISFFKRRSRQRRIINSRQVERTTRKIGYETVEDNDDFYRNQVQIFSNLSVGISAGGAMLANMIFMPKGSTMVCLRSSRQNELELWKNLAEAVGINYFDVVGIPTYHGKNPLKRDHANFYISPWKLRKILGDVTHSST